ncbi:MAG TPA: 7-carboxy-7-deazaguanine synthase QueE [Terriglobales bacterium]|nr:7-carboxy-7-deazaguanine synthase QueE [Terriglobales bacterium]
MRVGHLSEIFVSFQGEGEHVGERHLFVRTAGCNLRCRYCDTPDSLERTASCVIYEPGGERVVANPIGSAELYQLLWQRIAEDGPIDALALTGGEPLVQADFLAETLSYGDLSVPVLLETAGVLAPQLERLIGAVDIVSMDLKPPSSSGERPYWAEHAEFLRTASRKAAYIKVVVDDRTLAAEIERGAALVAEIMPHASFYPQPMTSGGGETGISADHLAELFKVARQRLRRVRVLPQTHKMLRIQ